MHCGQTTGSIYIDDWFSKVSDGNLSVPIQDENVVVLSPNPTSDFIKIDGPYIVEKVVLLSQTGQLVKVQNSDVERVNLSDLATGVYYVKVFFQNNTHVLKKVIKCY